MILDATGNPISGWSESAERAMKALAAKLPDCPTKDGPMSGINRSAQEIYRVFVLK